jgi:hypothetical protein
VRLLNQNLLSGMKTTIRLISLASFGTTLLEEDVNCDIDEEKPEQKPKNMSFSVSAMDLAEMGSRSRPTRRCSSLTCISIRKGLSSPSSAWHRCPSTATVQATSSNGGSRVVHGKKFWSCERRGFCCVLLRSAPGQFGIQGGGSPGATCAGCHAERRRAHQRRGALLLHKLPGSALRTKLHAFLHNHKKTIAAVVTGIGAVGGIIGTPVYQTVDLI